MGKLVRDNIPDQIINDGKMPSYYVLSENDFRKSLLEKLVEESREVMDNPTKEEIADVLEVIDAILDTFSISKKELMACKRNKKISNGAFKKRYYLREIKTK